MILARRALLGLGAGALAAPTLARAAAAQRLPATFFVRIGFTGRFPIQIDPAADPGRVEIWSGATFVGCASASVHEDPRWDYQYLSPLSLGVMAPGPREAIKVRVFGELGRFAALDVKISEHPPA